MDKFGIHSTRVLFEDELIEATIVVENERIVLIQKAALNEAEFPIEDFGGDVIMPGLIDCHVHINEPGRADWEGFDTATKAAAAGGITSLIEMPLNASPVTTTKSAFQKKIESTEGELHVNCGFWGGVIPSNIDDLDELIGSGVFGIKAFLTHSGIDEFPNVTEADLREALPILKKHNTPLLVHAELDSDFEGQTILDEFPTSYQAYLASRPKNWEDEAIDLMIRLCEEFDTPIHIVHLSSSNSIYPIEKAKNEGLQLTVETCPHYLVFDAEDIPDAETKFKCAPPIRETSNNMELRKAVTDGLFEFIVSDHSPAPPEIKELESGNFKKAWGGIAGLQFNLPAIWSRADEMDLSIAKLARLMSENVAKFLGLDTNKGKLKTGFDADIVVWSPEKEFSITEDMIHFRHKVTPYLEMTLKGKVRKTYVGGHLVFDDGNFRSLKKGKVLKK